LWILKLNYSTPDAGALYSAFHKPPPLIYSPPLYLNYGVLLI
jgi:hypothetical protein